MLDLVALWLRIGFFRKPQLASIEPRPDPRTYCTSPEEREREPIHEVVLLDRLVPCLWVHWDHRLCPIAAPQGSQDLKAVPRELGSGHHSGRDEEHDFVNGLVTEPTCLTLLNSLAQMKRIFATYHLR